MHLCFVIDNGLPLMQKGWNNSSGLDYVKSCIESMLRQLARGNSVIREHQIVHLFATSNPKAPLSSFEHDNFHFNYQLKSIDCRPITFPAETLALALKHIGKFRCLTETETILGYREGTIYEAAMIFFFTAGLTLRKISKIEHLLPKLQIRSQYKFFAFQLCLASKNDKIEVLRGEVESSGEYIQLNRVVQKLNKGELRNIYKYSGRQSLFDTLNKFIGIYRPNLCVDFRIMSSDSFFADKNVDFFTSSDLNWQSVLSEYSSVSVSVSKVFLIPILHSHRNRNQIPLPQKVKIKESELGIQIDEITLPKFIIDLTKKLCHPSLEKLPFENYRIMTNALITKIEKQVSRSNGSSIFFPVYQEYLDSFLLIGLLRVNPPNETQLLISYANFPTLAKIISNLENRKNYSDNKKIEQMLKQYTNSIPDYFLKFLNHFFSYQFSININVPDSQLSSINKKLQHLRLKEKQRIHEIGDDNIRKHQSNTSVCCPIYSQNYKEFSRSISKQNGNKNISSTVFRGFLDKVGEIEQKYNISSYFSNKSTDKCAPVSFEIEKYSIRRGEEEYFNENIAVNFGNPYKRKKNNAEDLMEDTPMIGIGPDINEPADLSEVDKILYETKLAVETAGNTDQQMYQTGEHEQINYDSDEESGQSNSNKNENGEQRERNEECMDELDEPSMQLLKEINGVQVEEGRKMVLNPQNIRAALHIENMNKLKSLGMIE